MLRSARLSVHCLLTAAAGCASPPSTPPPSAPTLDQLQQATISGIHDTPVTLEDGVWEGAPYLAGGAARPRVILTGLVASGELADAAGEETVAGISSTTGGTGENIYLAVFGSRDGAPVQLGTVLVGDRVQVRAIAVGDRAVTLDVVEAGTGDAMCCPGQLATKTYAVRNGALELVSSSVTGRLTLAELAGREWTLLAIDRAPATSGTPPTLSFDGGRVSGFGGCNRYSGPGEDQGPGSLAFGALLATMMACPPPAMSVEQAFLGAMARATRYGFLNGDLVLSGLDGDRMRQLRFRAKPRSRE